jgi:hypothetical protein
MIDYHASIQQTKDNILKSIELLEASTGETVNELSLSRIDTTNGESTEPEYIRVIGLEIAKELSKEQIKQNKIKELERKVASFNEQIDMLTGCISIGDI